MKQYSFSSDMLNVEPNEIENPDGEAEEIQYEGLTDGMSVTAGGIITEVRKLLTRQGNKEMAVITVEDLYGSIDIMCFPKAHAKFKHLFNVDDIIEIKGKVNIREGESPTIVLDSAEKVVLKDEVVKHVERHYVIIKIDLENQALKDEIVELLDSYAGEAQVKFVSKTTGEEETLPKTVNYCNGLYYELSAYVGEGNIEYK